MRRAFLAVAVMLFSCAAFAADLQRMQGLYDEGISLYNQGQRERAIENFEAGLAIARESGSPLAVRTFVSNLSLAYNFTGNFKKGLPIAEEALALARQTNDPAQIQLAALTWAQTCRKAGKNQAALQVYEELLAAAAGDKRRAMAPLADISATYTEMNEYAKAVAALKKYLALAGDLGDQKAAASALAQLGIEYNYLGDYDRSIRAGQDALQLRKNLGDEAAVARSLKDLGNVYDSAGDYPQAILSYAQALKSARQRGDAAAASGDLGNLGIVYNKLGDYQKALDAFGEELKSAEERGDAAELAGALTNVALVYGDLGQDDKAASSLEDSIAKFRSLGNRHGLAAALSDLGTIRTRQGEYDTAQRLYEEALGLARAMGTPTAPTEAAMADGQFARGDLDGAEKAYRRLSDPRRLGRLALARRDYQSALTGFGATLAHDQQERHAAFLFADRCGLGEAEMGLKHFAKAAEQFQAAIALVEDQREAVVDAQRARFFAAEFSGFARVLPYEGLVRALAALRQDDQAFRAAENLKGRQLAEAIAKGRAGTARDLPQAMRGEEARAVAAVRALRRQLEALYLRKATQAYAQKEAELAQAKNVLSQFVARLRLSHPEYAALNYPQPLGASQVLLAQGETLLEFDITREKTYLFALSGKDKTLTVREIPVTRAELSKMVLEYRDYFQNISAPADLARYDAKAGKKIFDLLLGPALSGLPADQTLIIVPSGVLGLLPFESLPVRLPAQERVGEGAFGPFPLGVSYLGDEHAVTYAQSASSLTLLRLLKPKRAAKASALALADPIFSARDARAHEASAPQAPALSDALQEWKTMGVSGTRARGQSAAAPASDELFPRLEKTRAIAAGLKELFGESATVLQDDAASKKNLLGLPLADFRYIALATHGILDSDVPYIKEPALVLGQLGNAEPSEGFLTMSEVAALKLGADTVALTACQTGVGKTVSGEGVMGMGRAFQFAGADNVLMSLWSVAEDATVALSLEFFKAIKAGSEPRLALRAARAEARRRGYEHPFYWSSFILVGR